MSEITKERDQLRKEQAENVMPMIGSLLDRWEDLPNDVKSDAELSVFRKSIDNVRMAMEDVFCPACDAGVGHCNGPHKGTEER